MPVAISSVHQKSGFGVDTSAVGGMASVSDSFWTLLVHFLLCEPCAMVDAFVVSLFMVILSGFYSLEKYGRDINAKAAYYVGVHT